MQKYLGQLFVEFLKKREVHALDCDTGLPVGLPKLSGRRNVLVKRAIEDTLSYKYLPKDVKASSKAMA